MIVDKCMPWSTIGQPKMYTSILLSYQPLARTKELNEEMDVYSEVETITK
jgi:hypothetical protein